MLAVAGKKVGRGRRGIEAHRTAIVRNLAIWLYEGGRVGEAYEGFEVIEIARQCKMNPARVADYDPGVLGIVAETGLPPEEVEQWDYLHIRLWNVNKEAEAKARAKAREPKK